MMSLTRNTKRLSLETERFVLSPHAFSVLVTDVLKHSLTVRERNVFIKIVPALVRLSDRSYDPQDYFASLSENLSCSECSVLADLIDKVFWSFLDA